MVKKKNDNYCTKAINLLKRRFKKRKQTAPERKFSVLCKKYKIKYERQYYLYGKFFDFYLPKYHVLVEIDGKYWHGKGLKFQQKSLMQKKNRANDRYKTELAKIRNIPLYRIWQGSVKYSRLKKILNESKKNGKDKGRSSR